MTTQRIQFTLRDVLLVVGLAGFALFLSSHVAAAVSYRLSATDCMLTTLLTIASAAAGVYSSRKEPHSRSFHIFGWVCIFWELGAVGAVLIANVLAPSRMCSEEPAAVAYCKGFAEAEEIYHRKDYTGNGVLKYAGDLQTLVGNKGNLDLFDMTFAQAEIGLPNMAPKAGYCFKVLTAQGPSALGGRRSYIDVKGNMTIGYALLAIPGAYNSTGRDSYIINNNGTIFQCDLGPNTAVIAASMTEFDPDTNWIPTQ